MTKEIRRRRMKIAARIGLAMGLLLALQARTCSAQVPDLWPNSCVPMQGSIPGHSPPRCSQGLPNPPTRTEEESLRKWKLQEEERRRNRINKLIKTVELEGLHRGHELIVAIEGHRAQAGHPLTSTEQALTLLDSETQQKIEITYSDVEAIYVVRSRGENAKRFGEGIGIVLLIIVTLPLSIFGGVIGWDGC